VIGRTIEVGDHDDFCLPSLDKLHGATQAMMLREREGAAGDVQLLDRVDELQAVALGYRPDTLGLLAWRPEPSAVAIRRESRGGPDGPTNGGSLVSRRGTPST
jgi:hypothetical protein